MFVMAAEDVEVYNYLIQMLNSRSTAVEIVVAPVGMYLDGDERLSFRGLQMRVLRTHGAFLLGWRRGETFGQEGLVLNPPDKARDYLWRKMDSKNDKLVIAFKARFTSSTPSGRRNLESRSLSPASLRVEADASDKSPEQQPLLGHPRWRT